MKPIFRIKYYLMVTLLLFLLVIILALSKGNFFTPYFGSIHPVLALLIVGVLGGILLQNLISHQAIANDNSTPSNIYGKVFSIGLGFGVFVSMIDVIYVLPEDINVPMWYALFFYPIMGFVVEVLFHLVPLSLLTTFIKTQRKSSIWIVFFFIALLEPVFQTWFGYMEDYSISYWIILNIYLFVFNIIQLKILVRYGFFPAFVTRLGLYLVWHIIWGYFRLGILY